MKTTNATGILQLPPKFILAASTDKTREVITGILIDAERRAVVATNGRILAAVDIPGTDTIQPGYITPELWKSAAIMAKKGPVVLDYVNGTVAGLPYFPEDEKGLYPNWKAVVPEIPDPVFRTRLDPELLMNAAHALGWNKDDKSRTGITLDFAADHDTPAILRVGPHASGVIMGMGDKDNKSGHGLRIKTVAGTTSPRPSQGQPVPASSTPERSPAFQPDRSAMLANPIGWLRRLDVELRYLADFTPHGGYIYDYLTIGERAWQAEEAEIERDSANDTKEANEETIKAHEDLLKRIIESFESTMFDSIDSAAAFLHELKDILTESDDAPCFDHPKVHHRLNSFEELTVAKSEADFESMKAERDALKAELTQARNRITAHETAALHRKAEDEHRTSNAKLPTSKEEKTPEHSPISTLDVQCSTFNVPTLSRNGPKNGIELRFPGKPEDATREAMKALGFRWAPGQPDKPWIAKYTEERWVFATALTEGSPVEPEAPEENPATMEVETADSSSPSTINSQPSNSSSIPSAFSDF